MKKILVTIISIVILILAVLAHGFYFDWLKVCEYSGKKELVFGKSNITNYEYNQRLKQVKDFNVKESEHFVIYYPKGRDMSQEDIDQMEKAYTSTSQFWGVDCVTNLGHKINFIWVPGKDKYDKSEFEKLLGFKAQGKAKSSMGILYSIFPYTPHELNHVIAYTVGFPPAFLNEGFANYFNKVRWENNVLLPMKQIRNKELLIPIENLMENKKFREYNARITYPEAAMFVKFLVEEKGKSKFIELYSRANKSFTSGETKVLMEKIYNEDYDTIEKQWLEYLEKQLK